MALLEVKTDKGWVRGIPGGNQMISIFRGIPYAAPPVGENRFKAPQEAESWDGVRDCYTFPNISWQERQESEGGGIVANEFYCLDWPRSEDCLYLNVWTPAKSADEKLPVAVYMHGGGYSTGYGFLNCYDGEGFGKRGVIFVSINHRLNAFGFLAHPLLTAEDEHHTSGNYGILDLVAALKWVKKNIAAFGGDPDRISIFGQSGGGGKVQSMLASPLAHGLFNRAIMQSGGGLEDPTRESTLADGEAFGVQFFDFMGWKTLEDARAADPESILNGLKEMGRRAGNPMFTMGRMGPKIDGYVFPESVNKTFREGKYPADVDTMCGCTSQEMYRPNVQLPDVETVKRAAAAYGDKADLYLKASHIEDDPEKAKEYYSNTFGAMMLSSDLAFAENTLDLNRKPTYVYYLTLVPPGADTAHHSAEHHYVFQTLNRSFRPYAGRDWDLSNQLCDYWSNFFKTGNPNAEGLPVWNPYTKEAPQVMNIEYDLKMIDPPQIDMVKFIKDFSLGR
ncbi:MAG: carboxylesterase family protein [Lachnospiraceae bacterium]|nr:carboxylesterase family protein [Lachnospiraceae bacterium]